jgi:hypothetical protein
VLDVFQDLFQEDDVPLFLSLCLLADVKLRVVEGPVVFPAKVSPEFSADFQNPRFLSLPFQAKISHILVHNHPGPGFLGSSQEAMYGSDEFSFDHQGLSFIGFSEIFGR